MTIRSWMHSLINKIFSIYPDNQSSCVNWKNEEILNTVLTYFRKANIELTNISDDGRINSSLSEKNIITFLQTDTNIQKYFLDNSLILVTPNIRAWYDILITNYDHTIYIPINIKISNMTQADNISSKIGLLYAITGLEYNSKNDPNVNKWDQYYDYAYQHVDFLNSHDYYFFIINKNNPNDAFYTSLKTLKTVTPNGNNLPFQCKWQENRPKDRQMQRTNKESICFLLKGFRKSLKKSYKSIKKGLNTIDKII